MRSYDLENKRHSNQLSRQQAAWTKTGRQAHWVEISNHTGTERNSFVMFPLIEAMVNNLADCALFFVLLGFLFNMDKSLGSFYMNRFPETFCVVKETVLPCSDPGRGGAAARRLGCPGLPLHEESDGIALPCTREDYQSEDLSARCRK